MAAGDVKFGSLNLSDGTTYGVLRELPLRASGPEVARLPFARREGGVRSSSRFPERIIDLPGWVAGATASALETNRDALLLALANGQQHLLIGYQDERYFVAELMGEVEQARLGGPLLWFYTAHFLLVDPFAYAGAASQLAPGAVQLAQV